MGVSPGGISHDSLLSIGYRRNKGLINDGFYRHRTFTYIIRLGSVACLFFSIGWALIRVHHRGRLFPHRDS